MQRSNSSKNSQSNQPKPPIAFQPQYVDYYRILIDQSQQAAPSIVVCYCHMCCFIVKCYHKWADMQLHCIAPKSMDSAIALVKLAVSRKLASMQPLIVVECCQIAGFAQLLVVQPKPQPVVGQVQVAAILAQQQQFKSALMTEERNHPLHLSHQKVLVWSSLFYM